jgi:hypothetical protein
LEGLSLSELEKAETNFLSSLGILAIAKQNKLAQQLQELENLKREKEQLQEQQLCVVCTDRNISVVLLPCRHRCMCHDCSNVLSKCPICRQLIEQRLVTF